MYAGLSVSHVMILLNILPSCHVISMCCWCQNPVVLLVNMIICYSFEVPYIEYQDIVLDCSETCFD